MRNMFNRTGALFLETIFLIVNQEQNQPNQNPLQAIYDLNSLDEIQPGFESPNLEEKGTEVLCYGVLGCYSTDYPWTDESRPVSHFPEHPDKINPKYCLYTRANNKTCQRLVYNDTESLLKSSLVPNNKVFLISHGFLENGEKPWIKLMTLKLLRQLDCNVITINWEGGSSPPYTRAVANIRLVGTMTAFLIERLHNLMGVKTEFCHIIGHSLGAHLAGYAGNILQTKFSLKLGRITGLDPAEPHFSETDPVVRLDPTDAVFVDIIHTDITPFIKGGLGMDEPIGHLDFYPNSGENQPGCDHGVMNFVDKEEGSIVKGVRRFLGCDHVRSYEYFIESISTPCDFLAIECDSWQNFIKGNCFTCRDELHPDGHICSQMGFHSVRTIQEQALKRGSFVPEAEQSMIKLYTVTGSKKPFCRALYRVKIIISDSRISREENGEVGMFSLDIKGVKGQTGILPFLWEMHYKPGSEHIQVIAGSQVGRVRSVVLHWKHRTVALNPLTWRIRPAKIHLNRVIVDSLEENSRTTLCSSKEELLSGIAVELKPCSDSKLTLDL